jgi:hypothetical protein
MVAGLLRKFQHLVEFGDSHYELRDEWHCWLISNDFRRSAFLRAGAWGAQEGRPHGGRLFAPARGSQETRNCSWAESLP